MLLIYGFGKVGSAVAALCNYFGISYEVRDDSNPPENFDTYDKIIPSPGIPSHHIVYKTGKVKSELDFAYEFLPKDFHIIAVTGTDGKSTTSWILYELLCREFSHDKVYLSGNFDIPFSETVLTILKKQQKRGYIVVEISSFMSYILEQFTAEYSIFTNCKSDHLNWHKDLQDYFDSKMHILQRTKKKCILNEQVLTFAMHEGLSYSLPGNVRIFPAGEVSSPEISKLSKDRIQGDDIIISGRKKYKLTETHFSGFHNAQNILSATLVTNEMGICSKRTKQYLKAITGLPHRIELVTEKNSVSFIDDSKSTSCQSLMAALTAFEKKKTILIAGGSDKGDPFDSLEIALKGVKYAILLGATKEILSEKCKQSGVEYHLTDDMDMAVKHAYNKANTGDTVLLSPGCASFGLFRDYLDRANKFREAIKKLP